MTSAVAEETQVNQETITGDGSGEALPPIHLARCAECAVAVQFTPSASGAGFTLLDAGEQTFGVSQNGLPLCPNGHGEMALADEQLPVADAFALAQGQLDEPLQGELPGITPPFNYQGAELVLEEKAVEIQRLNRQWEDDKKRTAETKKQLDQALAAIWHQALKNRERRRAKAAAGERIEDLDTTRCTFEQLHPDQKCPLCDGSTIDIADMAVAPRESAEHAQQAEAMLVKRASVDVQEALEDNGVFIPVETIQGWTDEQREAVKIYALAIFEHVDPQPARPDILGKSHVASREVDGEPQVCTQCDTVLVPADGDTYPSDALVGVDCPGKPVDAQRYPTRHKKRAAAAKKTTAKKAKK